MAKKQAPAKSQKPQKKPRLFIDDGSDHGTVILNWHSTPEKEFIYMAESFYEAATAGVRSLKRSKRFGISGMPIEDFKAYPVLYSIDTLSNCR